MALTLSLNYATETTASIAYSASFGVSDIVSYSGYIGNASVSNSKGTKIVTDLKQGEKNIIYGSITCTYTYTVTDSDGKETTKTETKTVSSSITVYTHPGVFEMGASSDSISQNNIIKNVLTVNNINNWINHYQKAYHWLKQSGSDYSVDLSVKSNDPITAEWFNKCLTAMNLFYSEYDQLPFVQGGPSGTIISANIINQLNFNGTGE